MLRLAVECVQSLQFSPPSPCALVGGAPDGADGGAPDGADGGAPDGADGGAPDGADGGAPDGADGGASVGEFSPPSMHSPQVTGQFFITYRISSVL